MYFFIVKKKNETDIRQKKYVKPCISDARKCTMLYAPSYK